MFEGLMAVLGGIVRKGSRAWAGAFTSQDLLSLSLPLAGIATASWLCKAIMGPGGGNLPPGRPNLGD
jgi:hypothetical protein